MSVLSMSQNLVREIGQGLEEIQSQIDGHRQRGECTDACGPHAIGKRTYHLGGNPNVALISEAPGPRSMWITGVPFYGKDSQGNLKLSQAGANLNDSLSPLGILFLDVFFTDAVKCRPGDAKDWHPSKQMRTHCLYWLRQQLLVVRPRVILALGLTATQSCLDIGRKGWPTKLKLKDLVGRPLDCAMPWGSCLLVPLWHPSPANPRQRENATHVQAVYDQTARLLLGQA